MTPANMYKLKIVLSIMVVVLTLAVQYKKYNAAAESQTALGSEIRADSTIEELEAINGFKNDFKGEVSVSEYRKELLHMIHRFERNRGTRVLKSTIFSEGPILLKEF